MTTTRTAARSPRPINHIGVGVADLEAAIDWYRTVLGFRLISGPKEISAEALGGDQAVDVLGPSFRRMRMAHMTSANGVGLELFQLIDPPHERRPDTVEFWKSGFFHICVTDPDIDALSAKIVETGGDLISMLWVERGHTSEYRMCYCRDPFGNVIEIYTHSYELMQGHR
ncbi:MAG: VOC family protein [Roseiarcus sp.]|jgi:catechol 2,3-dioxygenase-like lactoylglutathione lyase family enzyme